MLFFIVCIFFAACDSDLNTDCPVKLCSGLKWVTGNYTLKSKHGNYYENWKQTDSIHFEGFGYFMDEDNMDTLYRQSMKWSETNTGVFMVFNVKNQNDNKDVEFKLTKQENHSYTFENAFRDYPSIITYKILNDTSINVVMLGFKDNQEKKEDFVIVKSK